eukprot:CAMPEP_0204898902 /NCGR_PEP_ID=MMETSP1397-20131031/1542_1 /ASSEMBLY_ACC=CAM_ASM_000891 /TAXON_ID=49980 /ORGANISM="Climacostomum Climacostomum virens, Strain Stock W-24" /LENGTH=302 /DNA_ID=CAMNT_0052066793 /DNA_START=1564 /DNA_END=2472 /DNA_ORIENTATION=+
MTKQYYKQSLELPGFYSFFDLGCSSGLNSTKYWSLILDSQPPQSPFYLTFSDLAGNDWRRVMVNADRFQDLACADHLFFSCKSGSFTKVLMPPGSVNFITSYSVVHWITKLTPTPDSFLAFFSKDPEVSAANAAQAREDLVNYLKARSVELKSGGFLNFVARAPSAEMELQYRLMTELIFEFIAEGRISMQEFQSFQAALWVRSLEDYQAALNQLDDLFELKEYFIYSPAESEEDNLLKDPSTLSNFVRSAHEGRILSTLKENRGVEEATATVNLFFTKLTEIYQGHSFEGTYYSYVVLKRK